MLSKHKVSSKRVLLVPDVHGYPLSLYVASRTAIIGTQGTLCV